MISMAVFCGSLLFALCSLPALSPSTSLGINSVEELSAMETVRHTTGLPTIAIQDFINLSTWKESWEIEKNIAVELENALNNTKKISAFHSKEVLREKRVSDDLYQYSVQRITFTGADFLIKGIIREFTFRLLGATSYGIAGYEDVYASVILSIEIWDSSGKRILPPVFGKHEINRRNAGASLAGGPVGDGRTAEFMNRVHSSSFSSVLVQESPIGRAIYYSVSELIPQISKAVLSQPIGLRAEVVEVRGDDIYLNVGSGDGIKEGYEFTIQRERSVLREKETSKFLGYADKTFLGRVRVTSVKNKNLSIGVPVGEIKPLRLGDIAVLE